MRLPSTVADAAWYGSQVLCEVSSGVTLGNVLLHALSAAILSISIQLLSFLPWYCLSCFVFVCRLLLSNLCHAGHTLLVTELTGAAGMAVVRRLV